MLVQLDHEAREKEQEAPPHFFALIKQLTLLGYFSSEIGVTQTLRYDPIPGVYDGCVPRIQGQSAWVGPTSSIG